MHIVVAHNELAADCAPDAQDVLMQVEAVSNSLNRMGHRVEHLACNLNLAQASRWIQQASPDLVFNLVESLADTGRLIHFFPGLIDALGLPYTGASAEALFLTSNKLLAKQRLHDAGMPTPAWMWLGGGRLQQCDGVSDDGVGTEAWIVKSIWEHASLGIDDHSLIAWQGPQAMAAVLAARGPELGGTCFAETFVEGREFNISILDGPDGPRVLPPAEILFADFETGKPHIVDYRAKWDSASFEYHHTPRCFEFVEQDRCLLDNLTRLTLACWRLFDLRGYGRVDFRVDPSGRPWILEVNANPCLSPDAGFAAAVEQAGLTYGAALHSIIAATRATSRRPRCAAVFKADQCATSAEKPLPC